MRMSTTDKPPETTDPSQPRRRPSVVAVAAGQSVFLYEGFRERLRPWGGWPWLARLGAALFVIALPVLLITTNVRLLFTTPPLYTFALDAYEVPAVTGIPREELARSMTEIRDYFTNDQDLLRITVVDDRGRTDPLFTPREVIHMRDVKQLVRTFFTAQWIAAGVIAGYVAASLLVRQRAGWTHLVRLTRAAMLGTLAFAAAFSVTALVGFEALFTRFHLIFFPQGFWQFDPSQDRLVQMFPDDFWLVSTTILAGLTVVEVLALLALSWAYLQRRQRQTDVERVAAPRKQGGAA